MTDMLIRDVPDNVAAALEAHARRGAVAERARPAQLVQDAAVTDSLPAPGI